MFLHPSCVLLHSDPEFVVFQEIVETGKLYMRGKADEGGQASELELASFGLLFRTRSLGFCD